MNKQWHAGYIGGGEHRWECVFDSDGHQIASIIGKGEQAKQLAVLIAASPDLLMVLDRLARAAEHRDGTQGDPIRLIEVKEELRAAAENARIVIAKAKGKEVK